ncbi:MAG: hypothetical protein NTX50_26070 [Candidatus Sumerlaeota bacterium]|nr:hypothetical protein [Candidatus Sumerlaeota bacterium]
MTSVSPNPAAQWKDQKLECLIRALLCLAVLAVPACATAQRLDGNDYIAVQKGNLPVILSAPHGGQMAVPGVDPRKGEGLEKGPRGFVDSRDTNVDLLAFEVSAALERKLGKKLYYVAAKFHRKYVDANRPVEIAVEDPKAKAVYEAYHGALANYCAEVAREFGCGLVIDIHGQGTSATAVFRGTQGGKTDRNLVKQWGEKAHSGPESFCGLFAAQGVSVFPINKDPEKSGYGGGYIVRVCGDREGIGAVQLEFGMDFRKSANIKATAVKLADAIAEFIKLYPPGKQAASQGGRPLPDPAKTGNKQ